MNSESTNLFWFIFQLADWEETPKWTNKKFFFFFNCSNWEKFVEKIVKPIGEIIWWICYILNLQAKREINELKSTGAFKETKLKDLEEKNNEIEKFYETEGAQWKTKFEETSKLKKEQTSRIVEMKNSFQVNKLTWFFPVKTQLLFCYQNCSDPLWEKIALVIKKKFWNSRLKAKNCKNFEITWTIYSNSERSEQFLVTEYFFNLFLEVSHI